MSYCRMNKIDSDVYFYPNIYGYFECCGCLLSDTRITILNTRTESIEHLREHIKAGHKVPFYAIERLKQEIEIYGNDYGFDDRKKNCKG